MPALLKLLSEAEEYSELPVRHNEDKLNGELARDVPWPVDARNIDDPHVKANLLFQAHFTRCRLPISDYITDTDQVLAQRRRLAKWKAQRSRKHYRFEVMSKLLAWMPIFFSLF